MRNEQRLAELSALKALIVDDNEHMRILLRTLLLAMNIRKVHEYEDGAAAINDLAVARPDFILTDLSMSPMDGLYFTHAIRHLADDKLNLTPVVMITGHTERRRIESARDAGVNEILVKPVTAAGLFQRIEEIIFRPRPFVRTKDYCGPCRRRHATANFAGPWRRASDKEGGVEWQAPPAQAAEQAEAQTAP